MVLDPTPSLETTMPLNRQTLALLLAALATAAVPATALAKHGDDDGPGDDRGGDRQQQSDDSGRGDDSGGRGGDDSARGGDDSGRGGDDSGRCGDDNGRRDRREVRVAGRCTDRSTAKLKVKHDDGRLETEFEVDQNRNGVTWTVQVRRNGALAFSTRATTRAPSGSFSVERKIADGAGSDRVTARATSPSGEVCTAATTF
jgi:hypothetical protein